MERIYEIIPGVCSWLTVLIPFFMAYFKPTTLAYFVICYDLYWLYKAILMGGHLISGYIHLKRDTAIDWGGRLKKLANLKVYKEEIKNRLKLEKKLFERWKLKEELENIESIENIKDDLPSWKEIYQAVILPTYKEDIEILRASIKSYVRAVWPKERLIIVLATEERDKERARKYAKILLSEFGNSFYKFLVTEHPDNLKGEIKAKGANVTWAAKALKKFLDKEKIKYENVIVSAFDADTRVHPQYFNCLAYKYIINPSRTKRSYQPIPLYANNVWYVPALTRIVAFSTSFWQLIEATRPYRMINFSSQAMSMKTLVDIDFWDKTIISEDSRQFYRAYFHYHGDHQVVPLFTPVYMDAVVGDGFWDTLKRQYRQKRRWAWGIEHFPYLCKELPKHKEIPFWSRFLLFWRLFEGHYSWATASLLIAFAGWLPFALNPVFRTTVLAYNLPRVARYLLGFTWIGILISTCVSIGLLPRRPYYISFWQRISMYIQWLLVPISAIFFGSIPALDAQTRLMLGRYIKKFETTKKIPIKLKHA